MSETSTIHYLTILRFWLCVFLAASTLARMCIATDEFDGGNNIAEIIYYITMLLTSMAWLLLGTMFFTARYVFPHYKRGPLLVICVYVVNVAIYAKSFQWYWMTTTYEYHSTIVLLYAVGTVSHIFLFSTLIPSGIEYYPGARARADRSPETESLVTGTNSVSYRTFSAEGVVPAGETGSWLSHLVFWWVQPLMKRGKIGLIQSAEDVFKVKSISLCRLFVILLCFVNVIKL